MARTKIECKNNVLLKGVHYLNSGFGERVIDGVTSMHKGVDLVGGTDKTAATDYIVAFESGIVTRAVGDVSGSTPSEGNCIVIFHGNNVYTYYYHLKKDSLKVSVGDVVAKGEVLAYMGNTGNSTGAHLHFGMKQGGEYVDPLPYLTGESSLGVVRVSVSLKALRRGDKGADVSAMQSLLVSSGEELDVDGSFGAGTESALLSYQAKEALDTDGVCGRATWTRLLGAMRS